MWRVFFSPKWTTKKRNESMMKKSASNRRRKPSMEENSREYKVAGFPSTMTSVDCVHIRLWSVSHNLKQVSTGKEKFPSRAFELSCNKRGIILSSSPGFYGSVSDKSIVKFDSAMISIR
jgi:hypothetical protein